jgi:hypothetical protein
MCLEGGQCYLHCFNPCQKLATPTDMQEFRRPGELSPLCPESRQVIASQRNDAKCHVWTAPAMQEKNLTFPRIVRVQPCIRPLNAADLAAGPDVIR